MEHLPLDEMTTCNLHKVHYVSLMHIHRPNETEFEEFRDVGHDIEDESEDFIIWILCLLWFFIGVVPPGQPPTKSSGLK